MMKPEDRVSTKVRGFMEPKSRIFLEGVERTKDRPSKDRPSVEVPDDSETQGNDRPRINIGRILGRIGRQLPKFWSERWSRYRFRAILIGCFFLWTPLLVTETLQVQHSCHPMILFSRKLPVECQQSGWTSSWFQPSDPSPTLQKPNTSLPSRSPNQGQGDLIAGTAGIAGATALAIGGAPVTLAVGVGILLWLAVRTIF